LNALGNRTEITFNWNGGTYGLDLLKKFQFKTHSNRSLSNLYGDTVEGSVLVTGAQYRPD
jgi:hypothetical protein